MKIVCLRSILFAALVAFTSFAYADSTGMGLGVKSSVALGNTQKVTELFSYPNNKEPQTLAQTVELYLQQSLKRDGLPDANVRVQVVNDQYSAVLGGTLPEHYSDRVGSFLSIGEKGYAAKLQLEKDHKWDETNWRFYLPLGLAVYNQRSAQLLHFPPDTSLTLQDYLNSATSRRWESLLETNGAKSTEVPLYERIIDIAPVAAPANAGSSLSATYSYFKDYAFSMLNFSVSTSPDKAPLPVVAYGAPVRQWVKDNLGVNLPVSAGPVYVTVGSVKDVPFLGANHPSYIWYVAKSQPQKVVYRVMRDDLVAACWQVKMGDDPKLNIDDTLKNCSGYWDGRDAQVCELAEEQAYNKTPEEAKKICETTAATRLNAARALRLEDMSHIERGMTMH